MPSPSDSIAALARLPLSFRVYDSTDRPILGRGAGPLDLYVDVYNISPRPLALAAATPVPAEGNYHLALRFRPGAVNVDRVGVTRLSNDAWACAPATLPDGQAVVYLLYKAGTSLPTGGYTVRLTGFASTEGARPRCTRVELTCRSPPVADGEPPLERRRTATLLLAADAG